MKSLYRLLVIHIGVLLLFFTVLCLTTIGLGAQGILDDPIALGFGQSCEAMHPCWNGIMVGASFAEYARNRLISLGYELGPINDSLQHYYFYSSQLEPGCVKLGYERDSGVVNYMRLSCMNDMSIGRFASGVGIPQAVIYQGSTIGGDYEVLTYMPDHPLNGIVLEVGVGWRTVSSPITSINLIAQASSCQSDTTLRQWHGFVPMWSYCQLEPTYPRCM